MPPRLRWGEEKGAFAGLRPHDQSTSYNLRLETEEAGFMREAEKAGATPSERPERLIIVQKSFPGPRVLSNKNLAVFMSGYKELYTATYCKQSTIRVCYG
jgi:hypothetical protein